MVGRQYTCTWCDALSIIDGKDTSCPACGAQINVKAIVDDSGWTELPPIRDMSRLQTGSSICQIEGSYVPVADFNLAAHDHVYFNHHVLLWKDMQAHIKTSKITGWFRRWLAGLPIVMVEAHGPGRVAFSRDAPGEIVALPLHPGQSVDVREGLFLVATGNVQYDWIRSSVWYRTEEGIAYPLGRLMDRFVAPEKPGLLLLHAEGNCFVRKLDGTQKIYVKPPALVYKDSTVRATLHIEHPRNYNYVWSRRYVWLCLSGTGRIAIQSAFSHWEDPPRPVQGMSYGSTIFDW